MKPWLDNHEDPEMTPPKPLYNATMSYRTPAGRRVLYGGVVAAMDPTECAGKLRTMLENEARYGRRRIASILDDFRANFFAMQITRRRNA